MVNNIIQSYGFDTLKRDFIKMYCTSTDPKGDLIECLKTDKCMKPGDKSVSDHEDRMEEMMRYSTHLQGARADLSLDERKTTVFKSFPIA